MDMGQGEGTWAEHGEITCRDYHFLEHLWPPKKYQTVEHLPLTNLGILFIQSYYLLL